MMASKWLQSMMCINYTVICLILMLLIKVIEKVLLVLSESILLCIFT